jgi:uncharacterized protein YejL (UPF0352 family)
MEDSNSDTAPQSVVNIGNLMSNLTTNVGYSGRSKLDYGHFLKSYGSAMKGMIFRDGILTYEQGLVDLKDATSGTIVFSKPIQELKGITRIQNSLFVKLDGTRWTLNFGHFKAQIGMDVASGLAGGLLGNIAGNVINTKIEQNSGIDQWVTVLKSTGVMKGNFSSANTFKFVMLTIAALVVLAFVIGGFFGH